MLKELGYWQVVKDGDARVATMYKRHYSCYQYKDNRRLVGSHRDLFMGPGQKIVLLGIDCKAIFGWRKFVDPSGQIGINCTFFRNEGDRLSSELILEAEEHAWRKWPGERLYTYVNTNMVNASKKLVGASVVGQR